MPGCQQVVFAVQGIGGVAGAHERFGSGGGLAAVHISGAAVGTGFVTAAGAVVCILSHP